ncbi:DUF4249 family protein [Labilibacter marinus]|uniref:DUF4249 family protein n=1 Tax=Labilibacter marinus TaxID=1477105 RepID=UPI00082D83FC|nr:DUF4249 family protein [Labilibacter marinus]
MQLYKFKYTFLVSFVLIVFSACTEDIDLDFDTTEPQLVVDASFTDEERNHFVLLSVSSPFDSNQPSPPVVGATVSLTDGLNTISLKEQNEYPGSYLIPVTYKGEVGKTYTLNISGVDINEDGVQEEYEGSNIMAPPMDTHFIELEWSLGRGEKSWHINLTAQEEESTKDYYAFAAYLNDVLIDDQISELEYIEDKYINGNLITLWVQSVVEEDGDGEPTEHILQLDDVVTLEVQSINENYYDFIEAVNEETGIKVPLFSGPPANVPTNISNGALGFFRVYSVSKESIKVTQEILDQRDL